MSDVCLLSNRYVGGVAYLVGKGPSLEYLEKKHFKDDGAIIAINQAIAKVEELKIDLPTYSFQKDGCQERYNPSHTCGYPMIMPASKETTLILTEQFSKFCLRDHPNKIIISTSDFGFMPPEMSLRICLALAKFMGFTKFVFVCCDSLTVKDYQTYDPVKKTKVLQKDFKNYQSLRPRIFADLVGHEHEWILPNDKSTAIHKQP